MEHCKAKRYNIFTICLSIKNVYGSVNGLDILLIDNPLQTIDDISAISLADLLTQQGIGQIVLSTHEDAKANLLRYKFTQAGLSVLEKICSNYTWKQ